NFTDNSTVQWTASPATVSTFTGWSGACTGTGGCMLTMDANKSVNASFTYSFGPLITATLTDNPSSVAPGDTIQYTEVVSNATGAMNATNVQVANMLDAHTTLVPGSLNISPLALDDSFTAVGNTQLIVNATGTNPGS